MTLRYAVDRLYATGWTPEECEDVSHGDLSGGDSRLVPSVRAVRREFERAGLTLSIKHNIIFSCHRAEWADPADPERSGNVVGATELEAAVYALAMLRESAELV